MAGADTKLYVPDFWEEHCTECGEPDCYKSCPKFDRAPTGRCRRFEHGIEWRPDGGFSVAFREWGKLELLFHGRMDNEQYLCKVRRQNSSREPFFEKIAGPTRGWLPYSRNPYGIYRSLRWRRASHGAKHVASPCKWLIEYEAVQTENLVCEIRTAEQDVIFSRQIALISGHGSFQFALPETKAGCLFRIFPSDGRATGRITFLKNELVKDDASSSEYVKCLAWDLDGTLWRGTLVEDGPEGLKLSPHVRDVISELDKRGIVQTVLSKNDYAAAWPLLEKFGLAEYFVFPRIDWNPKSDNLKATASAMNLGIDSFAFIDDSAFERGEVAEMCSGVRVYTADDIDVLLSLREFNPAVSEESAGRRESYKAEMKRIDAAEVFSGDYRSFLESCMIEVDVLSLTGSDEKAVERCHELVQRSNRLTLAGHRYSREQFAALLENTDSYYVRVKDRFGDYGIVGFVSVKSHDKNLEIAEFVMSCRVLKKGCERRVFKWLENRYDGKRLDFDYADTGKNSALKESIDEFQSENKEVGNDF